MRQAAPPLTFSRKSKEKQHPTLFFLNLSVTLSCAFSYFRSEKQRNPAASFVFLSLIRNSELRSKLLLLGKAKKSCGFLCFSLAYS
ncbi:MAG: hypothetical protein KBS75_06735 [Bacteroidales bacterium]|nr:hypothetical protein [Candidatus Equimonas faecalis]